jgi:hypothetical protein
VIVRFDVRGDWVLRDLIERVEGDYFEALDLEPCDELPEDHRGVAYRLLDDLSDLIDYLRQLRECSFATE